jgi:hypothetical protein
MDVQVLNVQQLIIKHSDYTLTATKQDKDFVVTINIVFNNGSELVLKHNLLSQQFKTSIDKSTNTVSWYHLTFIVNAIPTVHF